MEFKEKNGNIKTTVDNHQTKDTFWQPFPNHFFACLNCLLNHACVISKPFSQLFNEERECWSNKPVLIIPAGHNKSLRDLDWQSRDKHHNCSWCEMAQTLEIVGFSNNNNNYIIRLPNLLLVCDSALVFQVNVISFYRRQQLSRKLNITRYARAFEQDKFVNQTGLFRLLSPVTPASSANHKLLQ